MQVSLLCVNCLLCSFQYLLQFFELDLHGVDIGDEGLIAISSCIRKISSLDISCEIDNKITVVGIRALAAAVRDLCWPVSWT